MKFLIIGAGTIGLTYSWLLSASHEVTVLVKTERKAICEKGFHFNIQDLRNGTTEQFEYCPDLTTSIVPGYDVVLVMVNRLQLSGVLPALQKCNAPIVFMLNHWNIEKEVSMFLSPEQYLYGFPSQAGGGREGNNIEAIIFREGTVLGESDGKMTARLQQINHAFVQAGLTVEIKWDILSWLKVHYLQQSLSAGAIAKAGGYDDFASDFSAIKEMVYAFREGVAVCEANGIKTKKIFPARMFHYPAFLVAWAMKGMFNKPETIKMVKGHMKQGWPEWVAGYYEVLADGEKLGVDMPVWKSYQSYISEYIETV